MHMHIRCFDVASEVPLGDVTSSNPDVLPRNDAAQTVEVDVPDVEKAKFEEWVQNVWREKDVLMGKFLDTGSFVDDPATELEIPLKLRNTGEAVNAYTFFAPALVFWVLSKIR